MKVTCPKCRRRVKLPATGRKLCTCGWDLVPFSEDISRSAFRARVWDHVRNLAYRFVHTPDAEERAAILDFLVRSSQDQGIKAQSVSCAAYILRDFGDARSVKLMRCLVARWPFNPFLRHELANCLDIVGTRNDNLEALKQRILATKLEMKWWQGKNKRQFENVLKEHLDRLDRMQAFIEGENDMPTMTVERLSRDSETAERSIEAFLDRLAEIDSMADLPLPEDARGRDYTCVLDTNAVTSKRISWLFPLVGIRFLAPTEVLLEVSDWNRVEKIPLSFAAVEILDVTGPPSPEIMNMFSRKKGKPPSKADRMVAALAMEACADLIISDDRDLWDSGLSYAIEKNLGRRIDVVRTREFAGWLRRHGYEIVRDGGE